MLGIDRFITTRLPVSTKFNFYLFIIFAGESAVAKVRGDPADEHLPAAGDRPDAKSDQRGASHSAGFEAGHRRNDHNEREFEGRLGSDVRRAHTPAVEKGEQNKR